MQPRLEKHVLYFLREKFPMFLTSHLVFPHFYVAPRFNARHISHTVNSPASL